jgi:tRNA A-37 threonylcarbamoyl transferase component Bud32
VFNLEEIAKKEFLLNSDEIFSFEFENQKYWLKKARKTNPNKIQKFFYKFFPFELLIPSLSKTACEALEYETSKLEKFKKLGINTPIVAYKCDDFFVLEDCGRTIHSLIRKSVSQEDLYNYIELMLVELSKIHNCELYHGGSQTRNFTYKDGKIYIIDLEESFDSSIDIETLKFRDFLLFLLSFVKMKKLSFEIDYIYIIDRYKELTNNNNNNGIIEKLRKISKKISFFIWLSEISFIKTRLGSDVKNFFKFFKLLNSLEK